MRQRPIYTAWVLTCHSPQEAQSLERWLLSRIQLSRVITDTVRTFSEGIEHMEEVPHRLQDYFAAIQVLPVSQTPSSSFRLVFRKLPQAGRYWKDMMANILEELKTAPEVASVELDYKGDEAPHSVSGNYFQQSSPA